jgi:glucose/arabinose dehydrogenase
MGDWRVSMVKRILFAFTGFVTADGRVWGRPVGVAVVQDGSLLFSDDGGECVWRVRYAGK